MVDEILMADIEKHVNNLVDLKNWLDKVYYHPEFGNMMNRPVISLLKTADQYIFENLLILKQRVLEAYGSEPEGA